jgi:hypothetical protein
MTKNLIEAEFWWLVGILEGEGFFDYNNGTQRISVAMTDLDIIQKVSSIFTKISGREYAIRHRHYAKAEYTELYEVHVFGQTAREILLMIVPHMSARRRQRIWQMLNGYRSKIQKLDVAQIVQFHLGNK